MKKLSLAITIFGSGLMLNTAIATEKIEEPTLELKGSPRMIHVVQQSTELYARKQGSTEFKFSVHNGNLISEFVDAQGVAKQSPIKGIPKEFQADLNEEKIKKLQVMFSHCYFAPQGGNILVHARGLGGWGMKQHRGYWVVVDAPNPITGNRTERVSAYINRAGEGTFTWVNHITHLLTGAVNWGIARPIADACNDVDSGDTNPTQHFDQEAQSWHFNTTSSRPGGTVNDSRIIHAVDGLIESVRSREWEPLGKGLHPLQDVFAHTDAFTQRYDRGEGKEPRYFYGHIDLKNPILSGNADSPDFKDPDKNSFSSAIASDETHGLSQRYSDTKTVTYTYLYMHHLLTGKGRNLEVEKLIADRLQASVTAPNLDARGTHGIAGFLIALKNRLEPMGPQNAAGAPVKILGYMQALTYASEVLSLFQRTGIIHNGDVISRLPRVTEVPIDETGYGKVAELWVRFHAPSTQQ